MVNLTSVFVLRPLFTRKTAKQIAKALKGQHSSYCDERGSILIRWGSIAYAPLFCCELNHREAVLRAVNKLRMLQIFKENDIRCPIIYDDYSNLLLPCVGRTINHSRGKGFYLCENIEDFRIAVKKGCFFIEFIKNDAEYRVHVFRGEILHIDKKIWQYDYPPEGMVKIIKNFKNGYKFCTRNIPLVDYRLKRLAVRAVEALGLDFGAVDLCKTVDNEVVVFEVNTAPSLRPKVLEKYIGKFKEFIGAER